MNKSTSQHSYSNIRIRKVHHYALEQIAAYRSLAIIDLAGIAIEMLCSQYPEIRDRFPKDFLNWDPPDDK